MTATALSLTHTHTQSLSHTHSLSIYQDREAVDTLLEGTLEGVQPLPMTDGGPLDQLEEAWAMVQVLSVSERIWNI